MITVERAGVVTLERVYDTRFYVNQEDMLQLIDEAVREAKPLTDYNGAFAASVKIEICFFPDDTERKDGADNGT